MMQIFAIRLPALLFAVGRQEIMMHARKILFPQPFKTDSERIFHHRQRRLRHAKTHALRQVIGANHMPFILQYPARLLP